MSSIKKSRTTSIAMGIITSFQTNWCCLLLFGWEKQCKSSFNQTSMKVIVWVLDNLEKYSQVKNGMSPRYNGELKFSWNLQYALEGIIRNVFFSNLWGRWCVILHERTLAGFAYKSERLWKEFRTLLIVFFSLYSTSL